MRPSSTSGAAHPQPPGRGVGAGGVGVVALAAQRAWRAAQPGGARLRGAALRGGRQHGDQRLLRHPAAGGGHPGVAHEGALADPHVLDPQPATPELVAADERVVGEEGAGPHPHERRDHQHGRGLDVRADVGPQRAQPRRGEARGVDAGTARCAPRRAPAASTTPARPAARAPGGGPPRARARAAARPRAPAAASTTNPTTVESGSHSSAVATASGMPSVSAQRGSRHGEAREHGEDRQPGEHDRRGGVGGEPGGTVRGPVVAPGAAGPAGEDGGGARPGLAGRHGAEHGRAGGHLGARSDVGSRQQGAARAHPRVVADPHRADVQLAAVDPVAGQVDLGLDRAAGAEGEQAGHRRDAVQVDVAADPAAEQPRVDLDQRGRRQAGGAQLVDEALGEPEPQVHDAAAGVGAGVHADEREPGRGGTQQDAAGRADEQQPAEQHPPPADVGQPVEAEHRAADHRAGAHPGEPAQGADRAEAQRGQHLGDLGGQGHRQHGGVLAAGGGGHVVERRGEVGEAGVVVDVGDGDLGEALAQPAHELGRREAPTAEVEEVVVGAGRRAAEDGGPVPGDPRGRAGDVRRGLVGCRRRRVARAAARAGRRGRSSRRCGSAGCRRRRGAGRARPASCDGAARRRPWRRRRARWSRSRRAGCCPPRCGGPRPRHRSPRAGRAGRCRPRRARCGAHRP